MPVVLLTEQREKRNRPRGGVALVVAEPQRFDARDSLLQNSIPRGRQKGKREERSEKLIDMELPLGSSYKYSMPGLYGRLLFLRGKISTFWCFASFPPGFQRAFVGIAQE